MMVVIDDSDSYEDEDDRENMDVVVMLIDIKSIVTIYHLNSLNSAYIYYHHL